jgi:hypothetical protein
MDKIIEGIFSFSHRVSVFGLVPFLTPRNIISPQLISINRRSDKTLKRVGAPLAEGSAIKVSIIDSNMIIEISNNHVYTEQVGCLSKPLI